MTRKHPARKKPITPLSKNEDLEKPCRGISRELFATQIAGLKHYVAPGLGCIRNEHPLAILLNPDRQMTPSAAQVVDHFYDYADAVVKVKLLTYFYRVWVACRIVPANKDHPADEIYLQTLSQTVALSTLAMLNGASSHKIF